ncbi:3-keto-disaccharide hydrolase [Pedobacter sp. PWIIR3]
MNIKIRGLILTYLLIACCLSVSAQTKSLFNGKDLKGWHVDVPELDKNPNAVNPFIIRNGLLVSLGTPGGHLITDAIYKDFKIEVQYRFAGKPGNCGLLVFASTPRALYDMFPKSIEVQMEHTNAGDFWCIQEDISVPDMESRRGDKNRWGVNGDKLRKIERLVQDVEKPVGEWNKMVVECKGNQIKVWVNDIFVNHGANCTASSGNIALQSEGSEVEFRKVTLTKLK